MEQKSSKCVVEVFSRVTGFFRPVQTWNEGKQSEFKDRKCYKVNDQVIKEKEEKDGSNCSNSSVDSNSFTVDNRSLE